MMFRSFVFLVQILSVVSNTLDITETGKKIIKVDSTGITAKVCGGSGSEDLYFCYAKKTKDGKHELSCPENYCGFKVDKETSSWSLSSAGKYIDMKTACFDVLVKPEGVQATGDGGVLNGYCAWDAGTDGKLEISANLPTGSTLQLVGAAIWADPPPPVKTTETWVWAVAGVGIVIGLAAIIGGIVAFIKCRNKKAQEQQVVLTEVKVDPSSARSKDPKKHKKKKEEAPIPDGSKEVPSQVSSYKKPDELPSGIQKMMTKVQKRIKFDVKKQKTLKVTLDEDEDGQTPAKHENGAEASKEPMKNEEKAAEKKEMEAPPPKNDVAQTKEKEKEIKQEKSNGKSKEKLVKKEEGNSVKVEIIGQESTPEKENMPKAADHVENISAEPVFKQESKVETAPELPNFERKLELGKFKAGENGILGTGGAGSGVSRPSTSGKTRTTSSGAPRRDSRKKKHKKLSVQPVNRENLRDESDPRHSDIMKPGKEEKARQIQRKMIQEQRMRSERAQKLKTEKEKENLRTKETQEAEDDGADQDERPQRTADTQKSSDDEKNIKIDSTGITAKVCGGSGSENLYFCYAKKNKDGKHQSGCLVNHCGFEVDNSATIWNIISAAQITEMQTTCFDILVKPEGVQATGVGGLLNAECTWDAGTDGKLEISVVLPPGYTLQL
uniref:Uncharacterized protein n=1 Tax=Panagrolaimus sp. JU765 TaxID=591449 RepID=A0AC34PXL1_9BILA